MLNSIRAGALGAVSTARTIRQHRSVVTSDPLLNHLAFGDENAPRTCLVLHGLLGSAVNWTPFAKVMEAVCPDYRFIIPDLRNHGTSTGFTSPHTLDACAVDVANLTTQLDRPIDAILGHSLGGKIALQMLRTPYLWTAFSGSVNSASTLPTLPDREVRCVLLDTVPGMWDQAEEDTDPDSIHRIVDFLKSHPMPIKNRKELANKLKASGFSASVRRWLSANLRRCDAGQHGMLAPAAAEEDSDTRKGKVAYEWKFDPATAMDLLQDHLVTDSWSTLLAPPSFASVELVMASKSSRWDCEANKTQLRHVDKSRIHRVEAGHWVHVDNPRDTARLLGSLLNPEPRKVSTTFSTTTPSIPLASPFAFMSA